MILKQKEHLDPVLKQQLKDYVYDVVGYMMEVYKGLPCGLPEYIYQEALAKKLLKNGIDPHKEYQHHPMFEGERLDAYLKMDMMVEREWGQPTPNREQSSSLELPRCEGGRAVKQANIIIECKAIEALGNHERQQLFSYMIGSEFPIGILVNFATYPKAQIEKYYFDKRDMTITYF